MELFYSKKVTNGFVVLEGDEAGHCARVLRHREGDTIHVIDGCGTLYEAKITAVSKASVEAQVLSSQSGWGGHPYHLTIVCCPTKNIDRYEYFLQKATEIGLDEVVPAIGEHSERKVINAARLESILVSATKQSLKATVPVLAEVVSVKEYLKAVADEVAANGSGVGSAKGSGVGGALKLIAHCEDSERVYLGEALRRFAPVSDEVAGSSDTASAVTSGSLEEQRGSYSKVGFNSKQSVENQRIIILIGPEGDFSPAEIELAQKAGFKPIHLGPSRLRTETAAVLSAAVVYNHFLL